MSEVESSGRGVDDVANPAETRPASDETDADVAVDGSGSEADGADGGAAPDDEGASPTATCWACQNTLRGRYYEVDAQRICDRCAERVRNPEVQGTSLGRFARAIAFGTGAGILGAAIYYGIRAATDYEFGLIAIAVGFMVGYAVKVGSYGRGGWRYQLIAMAITYVAIVMTYVPLIVEGLEQVPLDDTGSETMDASDGSMPPSTTANVPAAGDDPEPSSVLTWVAAIVIALLSPILMGFENIMGTIIMLIGVYEAWKINQRPKVQVDGPYALATGPARLDDAG